MVNVLKIVLFALKECKYLKLKLLIKKLASRLPMYVYIK